MLILCQLTLSRRKPDLIQKGLRHLIAVSRQLANLLVENLTSFRRDCDNLLTPYLFPQSSRKPDLIQKGLRPFSSYPPLPCLVENLTSFRRDCDLFSILCFNCYILVENLTSFRRDCDSYRRRHYRYLPHSRKPDLIQKGLRLCHFFQCKPCQVENLTSFRRDCDYIIW